MENGFASSLTVAGPRVRRSTTDLLVGSDNDENVVLSESTTIWLYISRRKSSGFNEARDQLSKKLLLCISSSPRFVRRCFENSTWNAKMICLSRHLTLSAAVVSVATLCRSRR